ncbi:valine--tRNA ligase [Candidatus Cytomitobacter indipagum]|uniref:Valine--tRNA ligase n=1 Tax=Candidatus Cytomitobacter indipagum TaxID=2601575 RepID=A0A5C0UCQ1_9PROT|nr:valine--tRNA ligase [Candidatus Cytomitobacter indipagum]QEK37785.1 valine--tRNA ligase [Candidatus Cytomitobacter indipagum]
MSFIENIKEIEKCKSANFDTKKYDGVVVLPPPNITGRLHIGHALNAFVQDLRVRFEKLHGRNILWIPGTDHSGIATQILVEKSIAPLTKYDLGRENFLEKVWDWKEKYQENIYDQLKSLGLLLNWDYAKFTMDDDMQISVSKAFCELYNSGLIYKAKKMINWDVQLETAISDLEVKSEEMKGSLYYIKYDLDDDDLKEIVVATTRPETLFGDQAIAVNPNDERYEGMIGKFARIPLTNRKIKIISDERCEINVGTGAVKITPAHDFLDFEIGQDHNLDNCSIIDQKGMLCSDLVPSKYIGLDRFIVRKMLEDDLGDYLEKIENIKHVIPKGDRSGTVLEPRLTDQWFIDTSDLAKQALEALKDIEIYPDYLVNTYKHWMNNIQPWCISRQLWWGHRIPVWYCEGKVIVAINKEEAEKKALKMKLNIKDLKQDEDVLDTWFSSGLWSFTTIENNNLSSDFYPNDFLVTGSDILFFWVARMIMFGCFFKKNVPFKEVYLHGLVQDGFGKKMSKSKNNAIDPMEVVDKEGKDVLRFALLYSSIPGKNVKFGDKNIEHSRHFCIKIWNLYKYAKHHLGNEMNSTSDEIKIDENIKINHAWNIWIQNEVDHRIYDINKCIRSWDLYHAASKVYKMVWDVFCSWYLEGSKYLLNSEYKDETKYVLANSIKKISVCLHPFIPFLTSYIYKDLFGKDILNHEMSENSVELINNDEVNFAKKAIDAIRFIKAAFEIEKKPILHVTNNQEYKNMYGIINQISKCEIQLSENAYSEEHIPYPISDGFLSIPIKNFNSNEINIKLNKMKENMQKEYDMICAKCNNNEFISKAPQEVREEMIKRVKILGGDLKKMDNLISMLENSL